MYVVSALLVTVYWLSATSTAVSDVAVSTAVTPASNIPLYVSAFSICLFILSSILGLMGETPAFHIIIYRIHYMDINTLFGYTMLYSVMLFSALTVIESFQ